MIDEKMILKKLGRIIDPDFQKDIVSLGFVKNVRIDGGDVSFDLALTTPACPVKDEFQAQAEAAVREIPDVTSVKVNMTTLPRKTGENVQEQSPGLKDVRSIIAVSSCKGGVGKSTIAAHMALELARRGYRVGLVDADIYGPSVPTLLRLRNTPVYANQAQLLIPVEKWNLKVMSFGLLLGDSPAVLRGPLVSRYVQQIVHQTAWGSLDYLFVDMPPGTGDVQLTITQSVPLAGAVIVTTRQTLSLVDVGRGILMFEKVNVPILGIVENMSYFVCNQCDKKHFIFGESHSGHLQQRFGTPTLAEIPLLTAFAQHIEEPPANEYIMGCVDQTVRWLGTASIQEKQIPEIENSGSDLGVTWPNGQKRRVPARALRLACRCALCVDELTGEHLIQESEVPEDLRAEQITPLGNYAVGITWSDGHASGIYPYAQLRELGEAIVSTPRQ